MTAISSTPEPDESQATQDKRRGRFVPWVIIAFYMTFMLAFIGFVYVAFKNPPSETTQEAYEKGLAYNDTLDKAQAEAHLGWTSNTVFIGNRLIFSLQSKDGAPVTGAKVKAWFVHPAQASNDRNFDLLEADPGEYSTVVNLPSRGAWNIHLTASRGADEFQVANETMY